MRHEVNVYRVHIDGGRVVHFVGALVQDVAHSSSLCGMKPWPGEWSLEDARELPLCVDCIHGATRPSRKRKRS